MESLTCVQLFARIARLRYQRSRHQLYNIRFSLASHTGERDQDLSLVCSLAIWGSS